MTLTPTITQTPTVTFSPTIIYTPTITLSPTNTFTPTITLTPIWSLTPYLNSSQLLSGLGGPVLAPVPVLMGNSIFLFPDRPIEASQWDIFNLLGESVASLSFSSPLSNSWNTQGVAPGLYAVRLKLSYSDGTSAIVWKKIVVSR